MAITYTPSDVRRLAKELDPEYASLDDDEREALHDYADKALSAALSVVQERAKYTVVGQLYRGPGTHWRTAVEAERSKVCLGFYSTEGDARKAAESLFTNNSSHEEWQAWWLPVDHRSPSEHHAHRKAQLAEAALIAKAEGKITPEEWQEAWYAQSQAWYEALSTAEKRAVDKRVAKVAQIGEAA